MGFFDFLRPGLTEADKQLRVEIYNVTSVKPGNLNIYRQAFRHASVSKHIEGTKIKNSNERLEFLGDAILNAIVARMLFLKFPFQDEGFLTQLRSKIVSRDSLNAIARKTGILELVELDPKMGYDQTRLKSMPGNTLEALIGAIYVDKGYEVTEQYVVKSLLAIHVDVDALVHLETNYKSRIINHCQKEGKNIRFKVVGEEAAQNNQKKFRIQVVINDEAFGIGEDFNKRKAEQEAAEKSCKMLGV